MSEETGQQKMRANHWPLKLVLAALILLIIFLAGFLALLTNLPENVIARGVTIGQIDLGGLTKEQAERILIRQTEIVENQGVSFVYKNVLINLSSIKHSVTNPEISATIFDYDLAKTTESALAWGRTGNSLNQIFTRFYLRLFDKKIEPVYLLSSEEVLKILKVSLASLETIKKDAALKVESIPDLKIKVTDEEAGKSFDYNLALVELKKRLDNLDSSDILLKLNKVEPVITKIEAEKMAPALAEALSKGEIVLQFAEKNFTVEPVEWAKWVIVSKENDEVSLSIDDAILKEYLQNKVAPEIETEFEEAKFIMENGKVKEFKPGQAGQKIDVVAVWKKAQETLLAKGERKIQLVTQVVQPELSLGKVNDYGIKELLGVGKTNFKGSPNNRRKNIAVGAASLSGVLIAPGEIFSTITKLKPIDGTNGYLPELVIKGNKTMPEFGGGLCQVSTTLFRAVLAAGLPVVERAAHAYRVSYYEPPVGLDATIYDPAPDFRFLNDTGNYILVQGRIEGDNLIFEFWGSKDGREIKRTEPQVFNIKAPPAPKLIETLDLPVGQKKCTEKAHAGAEAAFDYIVTYADGTIKKQKFESKYRPWGEVCMIGVEKLSEPATADGLISATSTPGNGNGAVVPVPVVP